MAACTLVVAGCNVLTLGPGAKERLEKEPIAGAPAKFSYRVSQFVFFSDFDIPRNLPLFRELGNLREQVYKELQLPPANDMVQVFLFEDREHYEKFMNLKYPELPKRRAFFVAQPRRLGGAEDLLVYTYWGDRIQQDLRHELTHALLHCVLKDVPLWLDEGLAEYFEVPQGWNGVNLQHIEHYRQPGALRFNLDRLERITDVQEMAPAEYREAWAWTHCMLRGHPQARQALIGYLQELRSNNRPGSLRPRLEKVFLNTPEQAVERHIAELTRTKK